MLKAKCTWNHRKRRIHDVFHRLLSRFRVFDEAVHNHTFRKASDKLAVAHHGHLRDSALGHDPDYRAKGVLGRSIRQLLVAIPSTQNPVNRNLRHT